jgi:hypothetical protein
MNTGSGIDIVFIGRSATHGKLVQTLDYRTSHKLILGGF